MQFLNSEAVQYNEYWESIKKYNLWFIKLRYLAVISLLLSTLSFEFLFHFEIEIFQHFVVVILCAIISGYNFYFQKFIGKSLNDIAGGLVYLRMSFYQILLDLITLSILVYFSGGIESPYFLFFLFHMIIGSLILPKNVISIIAVLMIVIFSTFSLLELNGIIPHFSIGGLNKYPIYNDTQFVISRLLVFSFVMLTAIYLTSIISKDLYSRERELKSALDMLHEAEQSKQKYIMAVVHELKSPIAAASSFLDLVIGGYSGKVDDTAKDKLVKARARTGESTENINEILRVSKFKLMNQLELSDVDLARSIKEAIDSVSAVAERKGHDIVYESTESPVILQADTVLLKLALSNLIGNAVKYTPKEGQIIIKIEQSEKKTSLQISDNGIGIPKDDLDKIFNEFFRASNTKDHKIEGTGTGLNAVKHIVDEHGWNIYVHSPSNVGSKSRPGTDFRIEFFKDK